jgi:hypothetical protein
MLVVSVDVKSTSLPLHIHEFRDLLLRLSFIIRQMFPVTASALWVCPHLGAGWPAPRPPPVMPSSFLIALYSLT